MPTLDQLRAKLPELQGLDDNQALDVIHEVYYPTADKTLIASKLGVKFSPPEDPNAPGDFARGFKKAMYQVPQTAGGALALAGDAMGSDAVRDYGLGVYQNYDDKIGKITKDSDSLTNVLQGDASGVDWAQNAAGYVAGQALQALATGGAGGFIGKQLALRGIKGVAERAVESQMAKQVAEKVAARGIKAGAGTALFGSNLMQEAGSIYPDALAQAQQDGRTLDAGDKARVAGAALAAAGVDTAMEGVMAGRLLNGGRRAGEGMARAAMREIPGMAAKEAATEGVQTAIERAGAGQDLSTADAIRDYVDSVGVGAMGGGMGGAASILHAQKVPDAGPLSRAANVSIDQQILQLQHDPQPLISFPDGSVGHKQDLEAYLAQFTDPEERTRKRREIMGRDPETGKRPAPPPEPTVADNAANEAANLKAWGARHDGVALDYAQALIAAPGAPDGLMIVPHPSGKKYTVVPSKWLTLDSQAKFAALQKGDAAKLPGPDSEVPNGAIRVDAEGGAAPETYGEQVRTTQQQRAEAAKREEFDVSVPHGTKAAPRAAEPEPAAASEPAAPQPIYTPSGKPFMTEFAAKRRLKEVANTHELAKVADGWVLMPKAAKGEADATALPANQGATGIPGAATAGGSGPADGRAAGGTGLADGPGRTATAADAKSGQPDPVRAAGGTDAKPALTHPRVVVGNPDGWTNQNAQAARDLADRRALTGKIEDAFAQGKTAAQVRTDLKDDLAFMPAEEQPGFIVGVRATLGIPSQADADGQRDFTAWKADYDRRKAGTQAFAPESGTLGIPRDQMPQVPTQSHGGLVRHLNAQGIEHETTLVDPNTLKPTQAEFSPDKVEQAKESTGDRAVIVSNDGHIIDGHHQVLAAQEEGKDVKAIVLDAPIDKALEAVKNSPSATTAAEQKGETDVHPQTAQGAHQEEPQPGEKGKAAEPAATPAVEPAGQAVEKTTQAAEPKPEPAKEVPAPKQGYVVKDDGHFMDAPDTLRQRLTKLDTEGAPALIVNGSNVTGAKYALYEPGHRTHYTHEWRAIQGEASGNDAVKIALRYRDESDIVAMTRAAQEQMQQETAAIAAQKEADERAKAEREAARVKEQELAGALRERFSSVKFTREKVAVRTDKGGDMVDAWVYKGAAVHKTHLGTGKQYQVTHVNTGMRIGSDFASLADAKLAAARYAEAADLNIVKDKDDTSKPEFHKVREIAMAMRGERAWDNGNPLARPELSLNTPAPTPSTKPKALQERDRKVAQKAEGARKPKAEQPAAGEAEKPAAPIGDFGEKLHGARKDLWTSFKHNMKEELPADVRDITVAKHFPEPNYEALLDEGVDVKVLAALKAMRDAIPAKPRVGFKVRAWGEKIKTLRELANHMLDGDMAADQMLAEMRKVNGLRDFADRIEWYAKLGYPLFTKAKDYLIEKNHYSMFQGQTPPGGVTKFELSRPGERSAYFDTLDQAVEAVRAKIEAQQEAGEKGKAKTKLDLYRLTGSRDIIIGKKVGPGKFIDLKTGLKTVTEARAYLAEHEDELLALLEKKKDVRPERRSVNDPRVGIDRRKGEDVTPEKFADTFGFRGVQFGNYVEQKRRATDLNNAYDALLDMADLLGLPPRALSLNGTLGLAFGARGSGGKNAAAAHFEPGQVVINLTKGNGAGSLAHEWSHGLDNYFERMRGNEIGHVTDKPTVRMLPDANRKLVVPDDSVRPEVLAAFKGVMDAIRASGMVKRSKELDGRRTKDYWSTGPELFARAFESYVIDKAAENGNSNDYLANIVSEEAHEAMNGMLGDDQPFPYPVKTEKPSINAAFDHLFNTIEARPQDNGNVLLASVNKSTFYSDKTIEVDGKRRPVTNSKGQLVAADAAGQIAFWKWFGDSAVVDEQGRPMVVYHGTGQDFDQFKGATYLTAHDGQAADYANNSAEATGGTARIIPAYVSLKNPAIVDGDYIEWAGYEKAEIDRLIAKGHDGMMNESMSEIVAFHPEQIKSATGNAGTFDPTSADITAKAGQSTASPMDSQIAGMVREGASVDKVLAHIEANSGNADFRTLAAALRKLGLKTGILFERATGTYTAGVEAGMATAAYKASTDTAYLHQEDGAEQNTLHELVHAATLKALAKGGLAAQQMKALWKHIKSLPNFAGEYGITNEEEFVAEAYTNPRFRQLLADTPAPDSKLSLWQKLVGIVRILLGKPAISDNVLDRVMSTGEALMQENKDGGTASGAVRPSGEAFKRWFGNSKVVDEDGKPLVVYHGTDADFEKPKGVFWTSTTPQFASMFSEHLYSDSGHNVRPVYLKVENPVDMRGIDIHDWLTKPKLAKHLGVSVAQIDEALAPRKWGDTNPIQAYALFNFKEEISMFKRLGFDGVRWNETITNHETERAETSETWASFNPGQVKNAIGASVERVSSSPDLRASVARSTLDTAMANGVRESILTDLPKKLGNRLADFRGIGLQALGRRHLVDIYAGDFQPEGKESLLTRYSELMQRMDADKNEAGAEADGIADRWGKLKDGDKLADLMHDATLAQIDPAKEYVSGDNRAEWAGLKNRFGTLSPEAQAIYKEARDAYDKHWQKVRAEIRGRIERAIPASPRRASLLEKMDATFYEKIKGVYFPLARFGDYVVSVTGRDGQRQVVSFAETMNEAEALRKSLMKKFPADQGYSVSKVTKKKEFNPGRDSVSRGFMQELHGVLDQYDDAGELQDDINQLYLNSMPDLSWAKHGIHRKGTPGFSQDARRAFAQNMFHGARYLAKLRYGDRLGDLLTDMQDHVDSKAGDAKYDSVKAQQVVDEMNKRHDLYMSPNSNPLSNMLTSMGFIFYLGLSPASAAVNLTQTPLVTLPMLAAKYGFGKASAALLTAAKQAAANKNDISKALTGDELRAYQQAVKDGTIDVSMAHDLAGIASGDDTRAHAKLRPVMKWASFMFHHGEKFNRQATLLAAYRLARDAGQSHEAAYKSAVEETYASHFDYSSGNRARVMQGNVARVVLLFKQYAQNMIYTLTRNALLAAKGDKVAQKTIAGLLLSHTMAAGVLGLPVVGLLLSAASAIGGDDDEPWDAKVALRNYIADLIGQKPAEVMMHGLSRLTPFDISGRVGLDKLLLPDVQEGLEGARAAESWMTAALGPVAGIGTSAAKGLADIAHGDVLRGLEGLLPAALRAPVKALRYNQEGVKDKTGIPILDDTTAVEELGQLLGFSPSRAREAMEGKSAVYQAEHALNNRRAALVDQWAHARMAGDAEGVQAVQEAINRYNEKNPTRLITGGNLSASLRDRNKRIREAHDGVYLPRKHQDVRELGRFAGAD